MRRQTAQNLCNHSVMHTRQRYLSVFVSGMALAIGSIAAADAPAVVLPASSVTAAPAAEATAPPAANKIWECTTKGVRTFSSNPCGTNPTVRELNPINVMEPPPVPMYRVTHTYAPSAALPPAESGYPTQTSGDSVSTDNAYNGYPGYVIVTRSHRARPNSARTHPHPHR